MQSDKFLEGAADEYYGRNKNDFGKTGDLVTPLLTKAAGLGLYPRRILEVGCANGWRLELLQAQYQCEVWGIDPSKEAIRDAKALHPRNENFHFDVGTADKMPYDDFSFDLVIVGFCMWLIEPWQWLRVVAETDRVLMMGGGLVVHDYMSPMPMRILQWASGFGGEKEKETTAWLHDFEKLWLGHPFYRFMDRTVTSKAMGNFFLIETAALLQKSLRAFSSINEPPTHVVKYPGYVQPDHGEDSPVAVAANAG
jgi:ubiquinone/menaquinone biosynthesis C-methylase UbiE